MSVTISQFIVSGRFWYVVLIFSVWDYPINLWGDFLYIHLTNILVPSHVCNIGCRCELTYLCIRGLGVIPGQHYTWLPFMAWPDVKFECNVWPDVKFECNIYSAIISRYCHFQYSLFFNSLARSVCFHNFNFNLGVCTHNLTKIFLLDSGDY